MISLSFQAFLSLNSSAKIGVKSKKKSSVDFTNQQQWNHESGWKNTLNNLGIIRQPLLLFWSIYPGIDIIFNSNLLLGFNHLIRATNQFKPFYLSG